MPSYGPTGVLCIGLGRNPFDASRTVAQECNTPGHAGCHIALSDGKELWPKGTNQVVAGGSGLAAWIDVDGVYGDSAGRTRTDAYVNPQAVGPQQQVLLRPESNADAIVWRIDGSETRIAGDIKDPSFMSDGSLMYRLYPSTFVAPVPAPDPDFTTWGWPSLVNGQLLYQSYAYGCLVYAGKVIASGANFYAPCGFRTATGYKFAYATQPQEIGVTVEIAFTDAELAALPNVPTTSAPVPVPVPPPVPVPVPEPPMSVPDRSAEAKAIAATFNLKDNSVANCGAMTRAIGAAFHASDANWGLIAKAPGEMQDQGFSQDSLAYPQDNPVSVKIISGAGDPHDVTLVWVVGGALRTSDQWAAPASPAPTPAPTPVPPPEPSPAPVPDVPDVPVVTGPTPDDVAQILAAIAANTAKLEQMRQDFIKFGQQAITYLPVLLAAMGGSGGGSGLAGLLSSLTKKS